MSSNRDSNSPTVTAEELGQTAVRPSQPNLPAIMGGTARPPEVLGNYRLDSLLGRGGMASVYLAHDASTGRAVALKLMDPGLESVDPTFVDRFLQEARANAELHHPHVVELLGYGEEGGWRFLATEFVDGGTVGRLLREMRVFPAALVTELLAQLLSGLVHSHERGVVHRDLKPENLLLTSTGVLKIADFGIARSTEQTKLTKTGMMVGTAGYMSPEQARGQALDGRSDLFSVGVLAYEMLTGAPPFQSDNPATCITRILTGRYEPIFTVNPCVSGPLEELTERLLRTEARDRFASAQEALDAVLPLAEEERRSRPQLVADALAHPLELKRVLDVEAAASLLAESRRGLENADALTLGQAALKAHLALVLDPGNADATKHLAELGTRTPLHFGPAQNPRIAELERQLDGDQVSPAVFTQLAQLYRLEGNPLKAVGFLKRYLRLKPQDAYVAGQLAQLLGPSAHLRIGAQTRELMAGIRTGGFKASQRATPSAPSAPDAAPLTIEPAPTGGEALAWLTLLARRFGPPLLGLALLVLAVRWVVRKVDEVTRDSVATSDQLRRNVGPSPEVPAPPPQVNYDKVYATALDRAIRLETAGENEAAVTAYEELIANFPKRPRTEEAAFRRAKLLTVLGRNSVALEAFSSFLTRWPASPDAPEALLRRGQAAAANLVDAEAEADFTLFLERHPAHALVAEAWVSRGELRARQGSNQAARADFEAALARLGPSPLRERAEAGLKLIPPDPGVKPRRR